MMIAVRRDVLAATGGNQVPWENSVPDPSVRVRPRRGRRRAGDAALAARRHRPRSRADAHLPRPLPRGAAHRRTCAPSRRRRGDRGPGDDRGRGARPAAAARRFPLGAGAAHPDAAPRRDLPPAVPRRQPRRRSPQAPRRPPRPDDPDMRRAHLRAPRHPRARRDRECAPASPLAQLRQHAAAAVEACAKAVAAHPEVPHYTALLARATCAAGDRHEAIRLYREAAGPRRSSRHGQPRPRSTENGDGVPRTCPKPPPSTRRPREGGFPDGAINLAVMLVQGQGRRARQEARRCAPRRARPDDGSAIATYNLGRPRRRAASPARTLRRIDYFTTPRRSDGPPATGGGRV